MFSWAPMLSLNSGWVPLQCVLDPSLSTTPLHMPYNGEHKQHFIELNLANLSFSQYGLVICKGSATKKPKQRQILLLCLEAVCVCLCVYLPHFTCCKHTDKSWRGKNQWGKLELNGKLCGKDASDVYSLTSWLYVLTAVSLCPCFLFSVSSLRFLSHDARIWDGGDEQRTSQSKWRSQRGKCTQGGTTQKRHSISRRDCCGPPASPAAAGRPVSFSHLSSLY